LNIPACRRAGSIERWKPEADSWQLAIGKDGGTLNALIIEYSRLPAGREY
jgi:hypothetical protein